MSGVFQDLIEIVNRTPVNLSVQFDGQSHTLTPGRNFIPRVTVPYAKNQNPLKGSGDLDNPTASGVLFLLGIPSFNENCEPLTEEEWDAHNASPSRFNADDIIDLAMRRLPPGTKIKVLQARKQSRFTVALNPNTEFGGNDPS